MDREKIIIFACCSIENIANIGDIGHFADIQICCGYPAFIAFPAPFEATGALQNGFHENFSVNFLNVGMFICSDHELIRLIFDIFGAEFVEEYLFKEAVLLFKGCSCGG
jgi:hypothetical protein